MRFVFAIVSFVIAFALIALGIAQRTVFAEANHVTASTTVSSSAPVTVISSTTLKSLEGRQTLTASGSKRVFVAYGRTEDVLAWVGDSSYNRIGFSATKPRLTSKLIAGKSAEVPDPSGSDLWLSEQTASNSVTLNLSVPDDISVLLVSDGKAAAPNQLSISWPLDNRTPWSGPLIVAGLFFVVLGIILYIIGFLHLRRSRGPRRKSPKMPKVPRQRGYKPRRPAASPPKTGRRSAARGMIAIPVVLVGTLALSGCSADLWPEFGSAASSASPSASASGVPVSAADQRAPAVTVPQLRLIVGRIASVAAKADNDKDAEIAKTRFVGPALDLRTANYAIRKVDNTYAALPSIPTGDNIQLTLPQSFQLTSMTWPRAVFTVVGKTDDKTVPPIALMLVQSSARSDYKVSFATSLEPGVKLPDVAPANIGAPPVAPESKLQVLPPGEVTADYGDIIANGTASTFANSFDLSKDALIPLIGADARKALQAALPKTATMTFENSVVTAQTIALGSNNSGAIVAGYLNETVTVKPVEAGAAVNPEGAVKSLSGITGSTKGTVAVYGDQLLFYVPPATSSDSTKQKVILLGFATGLISAKELP